MKIAVINKSEAECKIRVRTVDDQAKAGEDFEAMDRVLTFSKGEKSQDVEVKIFDDDAWEPDEDFFVELVDP